jgi:hypothetical protein
MSIYLINSSVLLVFPLSLLTIRSLNFTNIQAEVYPFQEHKEPVLSYNDTNIN